MKILQIVPALEAGGVERGTIDLSLALKKSGQNVFVISSGGRLVSDLEEALIPHIELPVHRKSPLALLLIPRITSIIIKEKIDIVHASSRIPAWLAFLACKLRGTVFVTSCHGFYSRHFMSRVMGWGKLVMVISKTIEKRMVDDFGVPEGKIRLIYRGVDPAKYPYIPDKYDRGKDSYKIINIGRLTPLKGQEEFIRAMKLVIGRMNNVEAWIVGGPDKGKERYSGKLKNLAKNLKIEEKVKFLGSRNDIQGLLKLSDLLVVSTNVPEGFGRVVIEAGAVGVAVCASGVGGIKEIIDDGVSGLLFPPGNESKMADTIIKMLSDLNLRKTCAKNLREKVEKNFTLDKMAKETLSVYEEALKN